MLCVLCVTTSIIVVSDIGTHNTTHTTIISLGHKMAKSKGRHRNSWHAIGGTLSYFSFGESGVRVVLDFCCSQCVHLKFPICSPTYNSSLCLMYALLNIVLLGTYIAGPILAFLWFYVCLMNTSILGSLQLFRFCLNDVY